MASRLPPTPAENLSTKGSGEEDYADVRRPDPHSATDPSKQGQQGNSKVNTTHQGYQQDR